MLCLIVQEEVMETSNDNHKTITKLETIMSRLTRHVIASEFTHGSPLSARPTKLIGAVPFSLSSNSPARDSQEGWGRSQSMCCGTEFGLFDEMLDLAGR